MLYEFSYYKRESQQNRKEQLKIGGLHIQICYQMNSGLD